ncbi:MaoC/PaaZ C-terminal domain-containing protein [Streptomyces sp. NPDC060065]|uniref:MaoC/PaaZ C-terminal domain-containing protein n=1 Tax=Streptomyces sp. NPDC060065 TaxID=3347050 RepID=UPI00367976C8
MSGFSLAAAEVGAELPELLPQQIDRATLAAFAESYGDLNPIHLDPQAARAAGLDDVIAHGMLSMALLGRLLVEWAPVEDVLSFRVSFTAVTTVPARLRCTARVKAIETVAGGRAARLALAVRRVDGPLTVRGEALVRMPAAPAPGARTSSVRVPAVASGPAAALAPGFVRAAGSDPVASAPVSAPAPAPASAPGSVPAPVPGSVAGGLAAGAASVASAAVSVPAPAVVSVLAPASASGPGSVSAPVSGSVVGGPVAGPASVASAPVPAAAPVVPAAGAAPVAPAPAPVARST